MRATALATLAAIAVQPIVFGAWFFLPLVFGGADVTLRDAWAMSFYVVLFAAGFVIFLGLPAFFIIRRFNHVSWRSLSLAGFTIGIVPIAIYGWPTGSHWSGFSSGGNWHGRNVEFYKDGVATIYGWLNYAESILAFGLQGLVGALAFLFVWHTYSRSNNSFKPNPLRSSQPPSGFSGGSA
jgi:hypothetical protein